MEGVVSIIKYFLNYSLEGTIKKLFEKFLLFFKLGNINEATINSLKIQEQNSMFQRIDIFCEEISNISNQTENFFKHLLSTLNELKSEQKPDEKYDFKQISYDLQGVSLKNRMTDLLGKFINYEQLYLVILIHFLL